MPAPTWTWRWTCVACGNVNAGGQHCAKCRTHWAGRTYPAQGRSQSAGRRAGRAGGGASSAHPASWRSSADPTGGAAADRRTRSRDPERQDQADKPSPNNEEDRIKWVRKELHSQIEKGTTHVRILTPDEAERHTLYPTVPDYRKDRQGADTFIKAQRTKLQQALANLRHQAELRTDLSEPQALVGFYRRMVYAALPVPEQLTQYERIIDTTTAKIDYCKEQAAEYKRLYDNTCALLGNLQLDHDALTESVTQLHKSAMKESLEAEMEAEYQEDADLNEAADFFQKMYMDEMKRTAAPPQQPASGPPPGAAAASAPATAARPQPATPNAGQVTAEQVTHVIDQRIQQLQGTLQQGLVELMQVQMQSLTQQLSTQLAAVVPAQPPTTPAAPPQSQPPPQPRSFAQAAQHPPAPTGATGRTNLKEQAAVKLAKAANTLTAATAHQARQEARAQRLQQSRQLPAVHPPPPMEAAETDNTNKANQETANTPQQTEIPAEEVDLTSDADSAAF